MIDTSEYNGVSGIYKIEHIDSGKVYVGSAVNLRQRAYTHFSRLRRGVHHSPHLQNAFNKFGIDSFTFSVLEFVNKEDLVSIEQQWMDIYESYDPQKGYNICPTAGNLLGTKQSEYTRLKRSKSLTGKKRGSPSEETRAKMSASHMGIRRGSPSEETRKKMSMWERTPEMCAKMASGRSKKWVVITPEGDQMEILSLNKFCIENNLSVENMVAVAKGRRKHHKGWVCFLAP